MPVGPNGEKRPKSAHANAVRVAKILTGEAEEEYVKGGDKEKSVAVERDGDALRGSKSQQAGSIGVEPQR